MGILDAPPVPYSWVTKGAKPVIVDTDWWTDTGDISGLRAAFNLEKLGAITIEAITINVTYSRLPESVDAFAVWDGRPNIPIGKSYTSHTPTGTPPTYPAAFANGYPHDIGLDDVPDAVTVMRRVLAAATEPVHITAIGYLNNVADLITSPADDISDLTGAELIEANETVLWAAAGRFPSGDENNLNRTTTAAAAGDAVARTWPGTLYWFGAELGDYAMGGGSLRTTYPDDLLWTGFYNQLRYYGRPSWDNMCITACALDQIDSGEYTTVRGTCTVNSTTGANTWVSSSSGPHYYLVKAHSDYYYECQQAALMIPPAPHAAITTGVVAPTLPTIPKYGLLVSQNGRSNPLDASRITTRATRPSRSIDDADLLMHFHADDLGNWNDGSTLAVWQDRTCKHSARQTTSSAKPTYTANAGGKKCVSFFGDDAFVTDYMVSPTAYTIYASVYFSSVPAAAQTICSWDMQNLGGTYPPKHGKLTMTSAGKPSAVRFEQLSGYTDTAASAISSGTWYVLTARFDPVTAKVEIFVNGTGTGGTSIGGGTFYANGGLWIPFTIGARYADNITSEPLSGKIHELRVYSIAHTAGQISSVVSAMA